VSRKEGEGGKEDEEKMEEEMGGRDGMTGAALAGTLISRLGAEKKVILR
jgi:hypothetical protein